MLQIAVAKNANDIVHQSGVASGVAHMANQLLGNIDGFLSLLAKDSDLDDTLYGISLQLAQCAHHADGAAGVLGEGGHSEHSGRSVFKLHIDNLVVYNIVVAVIDAASIRPGPNCFIYIFLGRVDAERVARPAAVVIADTGLFVGNIDFLRIVGTGVLALAAAQTILGCSLRRFVGTEVAQ